MADRRPAAALADAPAANRPRKILFVIGTLEVGGSETQLVELASRIDRARFEALVCSLTSGGPLEAALRARGVRVFSLGLTGFRRRNPLQWPSAAFRAAVATGRLYRLMRRERPDVVHGLLISAYVLATFVGRLARVRVIVAGRRSLGLFKEDKRVHLLLERLADTMTDLFIANSEAVRLDTVAREGIPPDKILVVYNGIDLARFGEIGTAVPSDARGPRVIVVSNLIPYKGHDYFLIAWKEVLAAFPDAVALLVGDGPARPTLEAQARRLGIEHAVRFLGVREDVPALLASADVFVHPSLQEGYSNAVLEAMAAGRPIVATAVGGNVEAIADGRTGLLVPPRDSAALKAAMLRLLHDRQEAARMGHQARTAVQQRHEMSRMISEYERIYDDVLSSTPRTRTASRSARVVTS